MHFGDPPQGTRFFVPVIPHEFNILNAIQLISGSNLSRAFASFFSRSLNLYQPPALAPLAPRPAAPEAPSRWVLCAAAAAVADPPTQPTLSPPFFGPPLATDF